MKKRRILSVLLCLALVVFSLSGCNKTSSKKSTSSKKADSGTLQGMIKSVDVDKKQITIATMPSGNQPPSKPDGDGANNNDNGTNSNGANDSGTENNGGNSANESNRMETERTTMTMAPTAMRKCRNRRKLFIS